MVLSYARRSEVLGLTTLPGKKKSVSERSNCWPASITVNPDENDWDWIPFITGTQRNSAELKKS